MSTFVRTTHATHPLLIISKMVVVLLLIFFPVLASANPTYQSSSNSSSTPYNVGAQSMQYQPASYQMTNTSNYQMSTTLHPAQTVYAPFSDETPGSQNNGPSNISGRRNGFENPSDPERDPESPIGEPWILLAFAAAAAVVITLRKKQTA